MRRLFFLGLLLVPSAAMAEPMRMGPEGEYVMGEQPSGDADFSNRPAPMLMPIRTSRSLPTHFSSAIAARMSAMIVAAVAGDVAGSVGAGSTCAMLRVT